MRRTVGAPLSAADFPALHPPVQLLLKAASQVEDTGGLHVEQPHTYGSAAVQQEETHTERDIASCKNDHAVQIHTHTHKKNDHKYTCFTYFEAGTGVGSTGVLLLLC